MTPPAPPSDRVVVSVPRWVAALLDPGVRAALVLLAVAAVGFAVLGLAWRGAAATPYVPLQVPWLVSGGFVGLALIGTSLAAWSIHLARIQDARFRARVEDAVRDVTALSARLRAKGGPWPPRRGR